jgi:hypothetical protein
VKAFITHITSKGLFSCVDPSVLRQAKLCKVLLPTISAQVLEVMFMATNVLFELNAVYLLATNVAQAHFLVYWLADVTATTTLHYQLFYALVIHFMFHAQVLLEGS